MNKLIRFVLLDILRNRIVLAYTLILASFAWSAFLLEDNEAKGVLTLLNIILLTVPLVSVLFATIYLYNSSEFIELLISQPIRRKRIWLSLFFGLSSSMVFAYLIAVGIPLMVYAPSDLAWMMTATGALVSVVFVSLAFLSAILSRDKARGIGVSILLWLYFALLFDGLVLFLLFQFSDYPIEKIMVGVSATSPLDLARILILLRMDVSAMMGYTGAVFNLFFGTTFGIIIAFAILVLWAVVPLLISLHRFKKRDL